MFNKYYTVLLIRISDFMYLSGIKNNTEVHHILSAKEIIT